MQNFLKVFLCALAIFSLGIRHKKSGPLSAPVLNQDFPDPSVLKSADGWFYAYATQSIIENPAPTVINLQVAKSKDLRTWEYLGEALPIKPKWAKTTQLFWAPDVAYHDGTYFMYFSAMPDSMTGFCLGVATSPTPQGPFRANQDPLYCGQSFVNIDPMAFDDPQTGERLLYWGSGFDSIKVRALAADRMSFKKGSETIAVLHPSPSGDPDDYRRLLEAAFVHYRDGYYYLFVSGDNCCGPLHYAVLVARSNNAMGPFSFLPDWKKSIILEEDALFQAPGHNAIVSDSKDSWIVYHAVDRANPNLTHVIPGDRTVRRVLKAQKIIWVDGWPQIADANVL